MWTAVIAVAAALIAGGWYWWREQEAAAVTAEATAARARREERERREQEAIEAIQRESDTLMPPLLEGIRLGMQKDDARRARPGMTPNTAGADPREPHLESWEERFPNGARAVYVFERESGLLQRVQVLSLLPDVRAIAPHLTAMNEQYGTPTGIWDCPDADGVPTRRFTWRHGNTTVADIFLIYGNRVSQTLYIAPTPVIGLSLRRANCRPLSDASQLGNFPVTSPEQMMGQQGATKAP